ncbi:hypothetical protein XELAEV_18027447mg [Xenopus laevis]|uniref:YqaJ viral recombinase domain-containing protein n=1 Tax=Xenopus laevis TaxID=8355 RepID=A0A974HJS7_XENLA|nr:hypothetical protein XELAEV_18027447mg [Xenopus laevis]
MELAEKGLNTSENTSKLLKNNTGSLHRGPPANPLIRSKSKQGKERCETEATKNKQNPLNASDIQDLANKPVTAKKKSKISSNTDIGSDSTRTGADGNHSVTSSQRAGKGKQIPEIHPSTFFSEKSPLFYPYTKLSGEDIHLIEKETRGQRNNLEWHNWRKNRITASMAHQISHSKFANHKTEEIPQSYLKAVLGIGHRVQTTAMESGIQNEKNAVLAYEKLASKRDGRQVKVEDCGLFIHPMKNWLAASPDGIVKDGCTWETLRILEVKFCLRLNGNSYVLRPDHAYYTQVQCQLAATQLRNADFVVYTTKETAIVSVHFSSEFWEITELKLERFYTEAVLPQLQKQSVNREELEEAVQAAEK